MPDISKYNLQYRPDSYFECSDPMKVILSRVMGQERRSMLKAFAEEDGLEEIHEGLFKEVLSPPERFGLGSFHPMFMGGEYLPALAQNQIEIARVSLKSTTADVISIRAQRRGKMLHYAIVDEYYDEGVRYTCQHRKSTLPLTMQELISLIDSAEQTGWGVTFTGLTSSFRNFQDECDPEDIVDFVTVSSEFYPELKAYYDEEAREWLAQIRLEYGEEEEEEEIDSDL